MDGVLCNYEAKLYSLYTRAEIEHNRRDWWNDSVYNHKIFEHLEYMPGAEELLRFVMRQGIKVEILTSTGHGEAKNEVYKFEEVQRFEKDTGKIFNPNSVQQLRVVLFDYLKLTPTGKLTKTGALSKIGRAHV